MGARGREHHIGIGLRSGRVRNRPARAAYESVANSPSHPATSMLRTFLASAALLACALPARAQNSYTSTRDTLRFRETTKMQMTLTMPQGEIPMSMEQSARLSLVRLPGDSARA